MPACLLAGWLAGSALLCSALLCFALLCFDCLQLSQLFLCTWSRRTLGGFPTPIGWSLLLHSNPTLLSHLGHPNGWFQIGRQKEGSPWGRVPILCIPERQRHVFTDMAHIPPPARAIAPPNSGMSQGQTPGIGPQELSLWFNLPGRLPCWGHQPQTGPVLGVSGQDVRGACLGQLAFTQRLRTGARVGV